MSAARNRRRRNQARTTCENCGAVERLVEWAGRVLCRGCYMILSS